MQGIRINYWERRMSWGEERYSALLMDQDHGETKAKQWALRLLRRALWFESVRCAFDARTAADLGRALDPDRYALKAENDGYVRDKRMERIALAKQRAPWRYVGRVKYEKPEVVTHYPDVLFRALSTSLRISNEADALLCELSWPVQYAIFGPDGRQRREQSTYRRLARHANSEGVAAMLILFRECCEKGPSKRCLELGKHLYFMTLTWCARDPIHEVLHEAAFYLTQYIFPLARSEALRLDVPREDFTRAVECLAFHVFQSNRFPLEMRHNVHDGPSPGWEKFGAGGWGQNYQWGLGPMLALRDGAVLSPEAQSALIACRVMKTWGWRSLRLLEEDRVPPIAIVDLAAKKSLTQADLDSVETEREWGDVTQHSWMRSPLKLQEERLGEKAKHAAHINRLTERAVERGAIGRAYASWMSPASIDRVHQRNGSDDGCERHDDFSIDCSSWSFSAADSPSKARIRRANRSSSARR
jgi:hypothetical protein